LHFKQFELFPFAMWQAFPAADYYGNSANMMDIRVNSLATQYYVVIPSCLPSFICWTSAYWWGCRSQSFPLLSASRCRCHSLAAFSPWLPRTAYVFVRVGMTLAYVSGVIISISPI